MVRVHGRAGNALARKLVGKALERLPETWRVFHDVYLDGENVDHVIVGKPGVFSIEVQNYSGAVRASESGLITHGRRNDRAVSQAHRQAHKLRELLGHEVKPLVVLAGPSLSGRETGKLDVLEVEKLVPHLLAQREPVLDYPTAREIFGKLDALTRGSNGRRRRSGQTEEARAEDHLQQLERQPWARKLRRISLTVQLAWLALLLAVLGVGTFLAARAIDAWYGSFLNL